MSPSIGKEQLANTAAAAFSNSTGNIVNAILDGAEGYSSKLFEFAQANTAALFEYLEVASNAKSSDELIETIKGHFTQQAETFTRQADELVAIAQKAAIIAMDATREVRGAHGPSGH
jgi:hypothetical protein